VDATAPTAIEAQIQAMATGQVEAANVLLNRLTLEQERAVKPLPILTPEIVAPLIRALEPSQERRSSNRYLGQITVAFNPSQVQSFLQANDLTMVSSQASERLVIVRETGLRGSSGLQATFSDPRLSHALTPLQVASVEDVQFLSASPSDDELRAIASKYRLNQVLIIEPNGTVTDVSVDTGERNSFYISPSAPEPALGEGVPTIPDARGVETGLSAGFADRIIARLESDWKQASAVVASEVVTSAVSVLYTSHADWIALQDAINTAAQIKGARLDALSKDGALMTISYGGDIDRLANELRFKGVRVEQDPRLGLVFRRS
jgi:hypothetical protein